MGGIARIKGFFERAAQTFEDIQETGLSGNVGKLARSISQVIGRYASEETEKKSDTEHE